MLARDLAHARSRRTRARATRGLDVGRLDGDEARAEHCADGYPIGAVKSQEMDQRRARERADEGTDPRRAAERGQGARPVRQRHDLYHVALARQLEHRLRAPLHQHGQRQHPQVGHADHEQQAGHAQQGRAGHGALLTEALGDQRGRNVGEQRADPDEGGDQAGGGHRRPLVPRGERDHGKDGAVADAIEQRRAKRRHGDLLQIERIGLRHVGRMRVWPSAGRLASAHGAGPAAIGAGTRKCSCSPSRPPVSWLTAGESHSSRSTRPVSRTPPSARRLPVGRYWPVADPCGVAISVRRCPSLPSSTLQPRVFSIFRISSAFAQSFASRA
ncbi:hypothetical protein D3C86_1419220 [compost metagenome]